MPTILNILSWIIFGLIVGAVAYWIDPRENKGGVVGATITGILGAIIGGFLANLFFGITVTGFDVQSFAIAIIGALILTVIERMLSGGMGTGRTSRGTPRFQP